MNYIADIFVGGMAGIGIYCIAMAVDAWRNKWRSP